MRRLALALLALLGTSLAHAQVVPQWGPLTPVDTHVAATSDDGAILYAKPPLRLLRSGDGGSTWNVPRGLETLPDTMPIEVSGVPGQRGLAYARVGPAGDVPDIYFSSDSGATFTRVASRVGVGGSAIGNLRPAGPQPGLIYGNGVTFTGPDLDIPVPVGLVRSLDGGVTWKRLDDEFDDFPAFVAPTIDVAVAFAIGPKGVYRSRNRGDTWDVVFEALPGHAPARIEVDATDARLVYVQFVDGVLRVSEDQGTTWRESVSPNTRTATTYLADPRTSRRVYAASNEGAVFESIDAARTWRQVAIGRAPDMISSATDGAMNGAPFVGTFADRRAMLLDNPDTRTYRADVTAVALVLDNDLWWNPQDPGWGVSIVQHASGQVFALWFTHDAAGRPTWLFVPGGHWTDARTFTGALAKSHGSSYLAPWDPSVFSVTTAGTATFHFDDASHGSVTFALSDGTRFESRIDRMQFGHPDAVARPDWADLWWNPQESGWGVTLHQQYDMVFATYFLYDERGEPTWFYSSDLGTYTKDGIRRLNGRIYRATAVPGPAYASNGVTSSAEGIFEMREPGFFFVDGSRYPVAHGDAFLAWPSRTNETSLERLPF